VEEVASSLTDKSEQRAKIALPFGRVVSLQR
jgi:hypothetical protein